MHVKSHTLLLCIILYYLMIFQVEFIFVPPCVKLFQSRSTRRDFVVRVSALEIYNETVVDLLNREFGSLRLLDDHEVPAHEEVFR